MAIDENKIKLIVSRSEYFQDILDKIPSWITRWANTLMFVIFLLIAIGMKFVKYPDVITSNAIITTDSPTIEIYSRTSGRIIKILKNDQENVKKGDWVIILNNSADYSNVLNLREILNTIDPKNFWESINIINLKDDVGLGDIQSTYFKFSKSIGEFKLFQSLNSQFKHLDINSRRLENLMVLEQKFNDQLMILEKELSIAKIDLERAEKLNLDGAIAKIEVEQKEIVYLNMKDRVEGLKGSVINLQLQGKMIEKENTTIDVEKNDTYFNLRSNILQNYNDLIFELSEWENKYVLSSPIDGTVNFYEFRTKDQFLSNEQRIFTITPNIKENYYAIIKLPISNSGKVKNGQNCVLKVHNFPYNEYGMLRGNILTISSSPKEGFYSVKVRLPNQLKTTMNKQLSSKSELTAEAEIIIEDLTLYDRIFNILINKNY